MNALRSESEQAVRYSNGESSEKPEHWDYWKEKFGLDEPKAKTEEEVKTVEEPKSDSEPIVPAEEKPTGQPKEPKSEEKPMEAQTPKEEAKEDTKAEVERAVERLHDKAVAVPGYTVFKYEPGYYTDGSGAIVYGNKTSATAMPIDDIKPESIAEDIKYSILTPEKRREAKAMSAIKNTSCFYSFHLFYSPFLSFISMSAATGHQYLFCKSKGPFHIRRILV